MACKFAVNWGSFNFTGVPKHLPLGRWYFPALVCAVLALTGRAESIRLFPVADATLIETAPSNSMGGATFFNAGTTQNYTSNRALLRFDIAAAIPSGARIVSVDLQLTVVGQPVEQIVESSFSLRRVLRSWGEGSNPQGALSPGLGNPALTNDATWTHRFAHTTNTWGAPGGLEGVDYSPVVSSLSFNPIGGLGFYSFEPTVEAVADVQTWLDDPPSNFGWLLKSEEENTYFTARRFASREFEDPNVEPQLIIDFISPPRFSSVAPSNGLIQLEFAAEPGVRYTVETQNILAGTNAWIELVMIGAPVESTNVVISHPATNSQQFFRLRTE